MSQFRLALLAVAVFATLSGPGRAAEPHIYAWSTYERDFLASAENGKQTANFEAMLLRIVKASDTSQRKPPPGILAEYGYLLLQRGNADRAIPYLEREAREWPESRKLMDRIIAQAKARVGS